MVLLNRRAPYQPTAAQFGGHGESVLAAARGQCPRARPPPMETGLAPETDDWRMFLTANRHPPIGSSRGQASPEHAPATGLAPRVVLRAHQSARRGSQASI